MTLPERLAALRSLHAHLTRGEDELLTAHQKRTEFNNGWFTLENQQQSLRAITEEYLAPEKLDAWVADYELPEPAEPLTVGLVLAGNIPLVGFHDILTVFVAGHRAQIKLSSKDPYVLPYLLKLLAKQDERAADYFQIVQNIKGFDAVIATGSNNSARYFEAYFGKYPHVIRRNRNAVAVLTGEETDAELRALGEDVFSYYGLGCRNVAKLYVPRDYDFQALLEAFHEWRTFQNHVKWKNNFDYNFALLMLNKEPFLHNGAIIIREAEPLASHIAGLYFERYGELTEVTDILTERWEEVQLVVSRTADLDLPNIPQFRFGRAQRPGLSDYADGVDTLAFLAGLPTKVRS